MSELSYEAKALIRRVGTADGPSHGARARVKRRLVAGLAGAATALGGGGTIASGAPAGALAAVSAGKVTVASVALWLAAGAGLGTAVSAPAVVSTYRRAEAVRAAAPVEAPVMAPSHAPVTAPAVPHTTPSERPSEPSPALASPDPPKPPRIERATQIGGADQQRVSTPTGAATSLAEETRLLEAAQRELARNQGGAALALLDEHAAKFPRGALSEERAAARILALCRLGRTGEARRAAEAFVGAAPQSPLVPRLESSCASSKSAAE